MTIIYIVRHGETDWNVKKILQGHQGVGLTKVGEEQARNLAKELKNIQFDAVFSSDLIRARRTAELIALEKKLIVKTTEALREIRLGRFEGKTYQYFEDELKDMLAKRQSLSDKEKFSFQLDPTMETPERAISRFITFLREIAVAYLGKKVLLVSHGGVMRFFLIHLGWGTYDEVGHNAISNSGYIKLETDGIDFFVKETKGIEKLQQ